MIGHLGADGGQRAAGADADPAGAAGDDGDAVGEGEALQFLGAGLVMACGTSGRRGSGGCQRTGARLAVNLSHSEAAFSVWMWSIM